MFGTANVGGLRSLIFFENGILKASGWFATNLNGRFVGDGTVLSGVPRVRI